MYYFEELIFSYPLLRERGGFELYNLGEITITFQTIYGPNLNISGCFIFQKETDQRKNIAFMDI